MPNPPRLKDSAQRKLCPFPLGQFPEQCVYAISKHFVYLFTVGRADISGEEWGDIFAHGVDGEHLSRPLGLADVVKEGFAWSVKSVKQEKPYRCAKIRAISGRNSPDYSYGITDSHKDIQATGEAVLGIWNERVKIALDNHDGLRIAFLLRNINALQFVLFELEGKEYDIERYSWEKNKRENFEGKDRITGKHKFTWQPHGGQFTIIYEVPDDAVRFSVKRPPMLDFEATLSQRGFDESWVSIQAV